MSTELFYILGALLTGGAIGLLIGRSLRDHAGLAQRDSEVAQLRPLAEQVPGLREKLAADGARLEAAQVQLAELESVRTRAARTEAENAALKAKLESSESHFADQIANLTQLRGEVEDRFKVLAGEALQQQKESAAKDISDLVKPLTDSLVAYDMALKDMEAKRVADVTTIGVVLGDLKSQHALGMAITTNLVNALRASPKTAGRWGEETLRRVMEMAGMVNRCDFETEKFFRGDENLRPDVVISLAGGRSIIVDAKTPFTAYLDAINASSENEKELLLKKHAQQMRERLTNLSNKSYWERISGTPDCVVMFVPGDNFVSAAFERDPSLFEDGIRARVLICTPTTFIALSKAISHGWRQEQFAQSAAEVKQLAKELYIRLGKFGDHIVSLGASINTTTKKFNDMVGSLETKVMPQARRFKDLGVEGATEDLPQLESVDTVVKFPHPGRDLLISKGET